MDTYIIKLGTDRIEEVKAPTFRQALVNLLYNYLPSKDHEMVERIFSGFNNAETTDMVTTANMLISATPIFQVYRVINEYCREGGNE